MWLYNNQKIESLSDLPNSTELEGFVYIIKVLPNKQVPKELHNKFYIGKKNFYTRRKKNLAKKDQSTDKRKKKYTYIVKESDWLTYNSSCDELKTDIELLGEHNFKKEILMLCKTSKLLSYWEIAYQFKEDVLLTNSYNSNINGKFFRSLFNTNNI